MRPYRSALILVLASQFWMAASTVHAVERSDVAALVESIGNQAVESDDVVGLSIGVAHGESVLCTRGFGLANVELNSLVTADTVFKIGSITKEFTAAAILLLVADGKIALDDRLNKFLADYPAHGDEVTIRHLLQHTSGVKDFTRLPAYRKEMPIDVTPREVLQRFKDLPLDFEPGSRHAYCNSGYFLLGIVVEKASGKSFRQFIEDRVLKPLELESTYHDDHARIIPKRAAGYTRWDSA
jgi:CubicO group peptidase (beta-lactamase class C family)